MCKDIQDKKRIFYLMKKLIEMKQILYLFLLRKEE